MRTELELSAQRRLSAAVWSQAVKAVEFGFAERLGKHRADEPIALGSSAIQGLGMRRSAALRAPAAGIAPANPFERGR